MSINNNKLYCVSNVSLYIKISNRKLESKRIEMLKALDVFLSGLGYLK